QWFALISIGLLMICAQACYINAIAIADASYVAPFSYMTLIFVTLYDFILFNQIPDHISLIGIFLILIGAILLAWREKINLEPKN
ncbi:MAG: EamA family transporter, partial [Rhodobacterales bacterium]|nr:EamA family transporter [Rhodobacterales bacterium]